MSALSLSHGEHLILTCCSFSETCLTSAAHPSLVPTSPGILNAVLVVYNIVAPRLCLSSHQITCPPRATFALSSLAAFSRTSGRRPVMYTLAPLVENPSAMATEVELSVTSFAYAETNVYLTFAETSATTSDNDNLLFG